MKWLILLGLSGILTQGFGQGGVPLWKTMPDVPPLPTPDDSGRINSGGASIYYAVFNKKGRDPVLLLHGGFGNAEIWGFEVPLLGKSHQVIIMDTRGHGRSSMPDTILHYALFAADVVTLLDSLHIPKISVAGWSDGGITGLLMAMYYPGRINKLFTYGANFNASGEKHSAQDTAMYARYMASATAAYQRLSPTPGGFAKLRKAMRTMYAKEPDLDTNAIKKIKAATVIGCGEYEQFYTREHFEALTAIIPGAKLVVIPNVSHGGPIQDPKSFHAAIVQWLGK